MQPRDIIGRRFMVGIPHPTLDGHTRRLLQELQPTGVILFRRNYRDPETLAALCTEVHSLFSDYSLLIALDHEGGRVHRLQPPFTHFPPAATLGRIGSPDLARRVGFAMGQELSSIGIDIDFAPVFDVLTNPRNTVIGDRAFAADPQVVGLLGCAVMRGLREGGVIPCGKHFPGHGATLIDSHDDLPRDERGEADFMQTDLVPFRRAIAEGAEMLMTAHVQYPALDASLPATLSPVIIGELLRRKLGFQGVVVTDDLDMGAIIRHFTIEQAAVDALRAGADLLLVCHKLERAIVARDACIRALSNGTLASQRIEQAEQRIAVLRQTQRHRQPRTMTLIDTPEHQQLVEEIRQRVV
ncbi:MAG: beta-N-acetylhexosaminidase [Deltaproteobacteria bacterium]|nr:beta-N-acetylhexosaminidase [Deltaproteobacteria bacterium]